VKGIDTTVRVTARCTVQRLNADRLVETVRAARSARCDAVSFLAADVSTDAFNRPGGVEETRRESLLPDAAGVTALEAEIHEMRTAFADDFRSGFIVESPEKLQRRLVDYFRAMLGQGALPRVECNAPWVSTVVETDGTVRPCYFQPPLGNAFERGLEAVLNSTEARAWRSGLDINRDAICQRCVCSLTLRRSAATDS